MEMSRKLIRSTTRKPGSVTQSRTATASIRTAGSTDGSPTKRRKLIKHGESVEQTRTTSAAAEEPATKQRQGVVSRVATNEIETTPAFKHFDREHGPVKLIKAEDATPILNTANPMRTIDLSHGAFIWLWEVAEKQAARGQNTVGETTDFGKAYHQATDEVVSAFRKAFHGEDGHFVQEKRRSTKLVKRSSSVAEPSPRRKIKRRSK